MSVTHSERGIRQLSSPRTGTTFAMSAAAHARTKALWQNSLDRAQAAAKPSLLGPMLTSTVISGAFKGALLDRSERSACACLGCLPLARPRADPAPPLCSVLPPAALAFGSAWASCKSERRVLAVNTRLMERKLERARAATVSWRRQWAAHGTVFWSWRAVLSVGPAGAAAGAACLLPPRPGVAAVHRVRLVLLLPATAASPRLSQP